MATERAVERRVVTVLFADLVGFTSLSEELDAEDVTLVQAWEGVGVHAERSRERALGRLRAPTLGRDDEVAHLRSLVGSTARVTVVAPPGVGKTRLLDELAGASTGAAVLRARLRPDML